jgi:hypothetical protein
MTNHYHLVVETGDKNLSRGMRQLNGQYSQYYNRRHRLVGHLFQGRYKSILVQKESHLREVARYVVLNPVRAGMVLQAEDWPWSSYRLMLQNAPCPSWLQIDWTLSMFGGTRQQALDAYMQFIAAGVKAANPMARVQHQLFLGDDAFAAAHQGLRSDLVSNEISRQNRRVLALTLAEYQAKFADRDAAIAAAYFSTAYTMTQIAAHFRISYRTVSRIVRRIESMRTDQVVCDCQT